MRTTITLSDGIARRLHDQMRRRGTSFRETLEAVLEQGLNEKAAGPGPKKFRVLAKPMGLKPGIDPTRLHDLEADLEVDRFLQIAQREKKTE